MAPPPPAPRVAEALLKHRKGLFALTAGGLVGSSRFRFVRSNAESPKKFDQNAPKAPMRIRRFSHSHYGLGQVSLEPGDPDLCRRIASRKRLTATTASATLPCSSSAAIAARISTSASRGRPIARYVSAISIRSFVTSAAKPRRACSSQPLLSSWSASSMSPFDR